MPDPRLRELTPDEYESLRTLYTSAIPLEYDNMRKLHYHSRGESAPAHAHDLAKTSPDSLSDTTPGTKNNVAADTHQTKVLYYSALTGKDKPKSVLDQVANSRFGQDFARLDTKEKCVESFLAAAHRLAQEGFHGGSFSANLLMLYNAHGVMRGSGSGVTALRGDASWIEIMDKISAEGTMHLSEQLSHKYGRVHNLEDPEHNLFTLWVTNALGNAPTYEFDVDKIPSEIELRSLLPSARRSFFWNWGRLQPDPYKAVYALIKWGEDFKEALDAAETPEILNPYVMSILKTRGIQTVASEIIKLDQESGGRIRPPEFDKQISEKFNEWSKPGWEGTYINQYRGLAETPERRVLLNDLIRHEYVDVQVRRCLQEPHSLQTLKEQRNSDYEAGLINTQQLHQYDEVLGDLLASFVDTHPGPLVKAHEEFFQQMHDMQMEPSGLATIKRDVFDAVLLAVRALSAPVGRLEPTQNLSRQSLEVPGDRSFTQEYAPVLQNTITPNAEIVLVDLIVEQIKTMNLRSLCGWLRLGTSGEFQSLAREIIQKAEGWGIPEPETKAILNEILAQNSCPTRV